MMRVIIGALIAAVAMLAVQFMVFSSPLRGLGNGNLDNAGAAQVQSALAANLPGSGTWSVPDRGTAEQTVMYGQGPIATIHFNTAGHGSGDPMRYGWGLALNFLVALGIGAGLVGLERFVPDRASMGKLTVFFAVAASAFAHLSEPIYLYHDWGNALLRFVGDALALAAAGLIIAYFLPETRTPAAAREPSATF